MSNATAGFHPFVLFTYFTAMILFSMMLMHPVYLFLGLAAAFLYNTVLNGKKGAVQSLFVCIPMFLLISLLNPVFSHDGESMLFTLNNIPFTAEAVVYGICSASALVGMVLWFSCLSTVLTPDKFLYLFSRFAPSVSLLVCMTLRMFPKLKRQHKMISEAQRSCGLDARGGSLLHRISVSLRILSTLLDWALEDAVDTADSMKARGYGTGRRTSFQMFRFDRRDGAALAALLPLLCICIAAFLRGLASAQFYPVLKPISFSPPSVAGYAAYAALAFAPIFIEIKENLTWRFYKSAI